VTRAPYVTMITPNVVGSVIIVVESSYEGEGRIVHSFASSDRTVLMKPTCRPISTHPIWT
jgi:hypothetical protein